MPEGKDNAVQRARELARKYMEEYGSCAQSAVLALQDVLDLQSDAVLRASAAMTGGIGGQRDACGGLLGAALIFGDIYGRDRASMTEHQKLGEVMPRVGKLYKWYEKQFGSATCTDIKTNFGGGVYYDSSVSWQRELANEAGVGAKCTDLVVETVAYMVEQLWDELNQRREPRVADLFEDGEAVPE